jgi:hypothetical protein
MTMRNVFLLMIALAAPVVVYGQTPKDVKEPGFFNFPSPDSDEYRMTVERKLKELYPIHPKMSFITVRSAPGEAASGVVLRRTGDSIAIDMTPCLPKKTVRYFIAPYTESSISDEKCGEKTYSRVQVIQLPPGR